MPGGDRPGLPQPLGPAATPGRGSSTPSRQTPRHGTLRSRGLCLKWGPSVTFVLRLPPPSPRPARQASPSPLPSALPGGRGEAAQQKAYPVSPPANLCP